MTSRSLHVTTPRAHDVKVQRKGKARQEFGVRMNVNVQKFAKQLGPFGCASPPRLPRTMLRNMLDGDGQDQYDSGGWCFPKPIPPQNKNDGQTRVLDPMMPVNTNEAFVAGLREYPDEDPRLWQAHKKEWQSVQGGSILTICKLHPSQRPPMVRPEDDNEVCVAAALLSAALRHGHAHRMQRPVPPTWLIFARSLPLRLPVRSQLGQQDVDEFIKKLVETGQPIIKAGGLGKNSLSAMGAKGILGAPAGVESNNFDGQRGFTGLTE